MYTLYPMHALHTHYTQRVYIQWSVRIFETSKAISNCIGRVLLQCKYNTLTIRQQRKPAAFSKREKVAEMIK